MWHILVSCLLRLVQTSNATVHDRLGDLVVCRQTDPGRDKPLPGQAFHHRSLCEYAGVMCYGGVL